jgi:hypothetical protein
LWLATLLALRWTAIGLWVRRLQQRAIGWLQDTVLRFEARAAKADDGPDAPVFVGQALDADEADLRRDFCFIGRLPDPTPEQRLTFVNVWGVLIERGDNPMRRLFGLAEGAVSYTAAPQSFAGIPAAVVGGGFYRTLAIGLGVTTLLAGGAFAYAELIEQPRLERRAARADGLEVALGEATSANSGLAEQLRQERAAAAQERAAAVETELRYANEMMEMRARLASEADLRIRAQRQARRAMDEAQGIGAQRSDDEWLRDTFGAGGGAGAGAVPDLPPGPAGDGGS